MPAHRTSLRRVRSRDLFDPADGLLLQTCDELTPATSADRTVQTALLSDSNTRLPDGAARRAGHRRHIKRLHLDRLEPPRNVRTSFLTQSFRRSVSRPFIFATARLVFSRRFEPRLQRASFCCNILNRFASPLVRPGTCTSSPVEQAAATATPRSMPTTLPLYGPTIESGTCERDRSAAGSVASDR